jgi:GH15 family glucan-1,4-alpha-glucosidase
MPNNDNYQPIENYGIIGNLNTIALVGLDGSIDFMCLPDFDSPTLFAALLDKTKGGSFRIAPDKPGIKQKQLYIPDTNILLTRFLSDEGIGEVTDFMPIDEKQEKHLIRTVTCVHGKLDFTMTCAPRFDYARSLHRAVVTSEKSVAFVTPDNATHIRLLSTVPLQLEDQDVLAHFTLHTGEKAVFALEYDTGSRASENYDLEKLSEQNLFQTINYWKDWVSKSRYRGRWMEIVNRSALVLKLMTSQKYGSIIASPTFGLPEEIGGIRNWDYRDIDEAGSIRLMYTIDGKKDLGEIELDHLEGYKNSKPVRVGNAAYNQIQMDIYGELLDAVYLYDKHAEPISYDFWLDISKQVNWVCNHWKTPDEGIWEVRGGKKQFLYSRMMCWVAIDRGMKIAEGHSYPMPPQWRTERDAIFNSIHADFWNEKLQTFVQYPHAETVDAATLLMPIVRFIGPKDPRWLSTLKYIEENLVSDSLVYRYRTDEKLEGLTGSEGTFSMCTFWYVECLSRSGQLSKARLFFEKMLGYANHVGLYSEQLGLQGQHLGNFPQAFTHLGLISAAISLDAQFEDQRNKEN